LESWIKENPLVICNERNAKSKSNRQAISAFCNEWEKIS